MRCHAVSGDVPSCESSPTFGGHSTWSHGLSGSKTMRPAEQDPAGLSDGIIYSAQSASTLLRPCHDLGAQQHVLRRAVALDAPGVFASIDGGA